MFNEVLIDAVANKNLIIHKKKMKKYEEVSMLCSQSKQKSCNKVLNIFKHHRQMRMEANRKMEKDQIQTLVQQQTKKGISRSAQGTSANAATTSSRHKQRLPTQPG